MAVYHPLQRQPWLPNGLRGLSSESDGRGCVGRAPGERCEGGSGGGGSVFSALPREGGIGGVVVDGGVGRSRGRSASEDGRNGRKGDTIANEG